MLICEFCLHYDQAGKCERGLNLPKRMACREFSPIIEKFCANPDDFVDPKQIIQMSTYFGIKGVELKKIALMAERVVLARS